MVISADGGSIERFLNLCKSKKIYLHNIVTGNQCCELIISLRDYYGLRQIVRKSKMHIKIISKEGFPFILRECLRHQAFIAGCFVFFMLIVISGRFVWNIDINGNINLSDEQILNYLYDRKIECGILKSGISCSELEMMLRRDMNELIWVSVSIKGTTLSIDVKENNDDIIDLPIKEPSNIVAGCDGVVESIIVRNGTARVKAGDSVKKGDVLIDSKVITLDESKQPVSQEYVYADGDVYIFTNIDYEDIVERSYVEKVYSGIKYKYVDVFVWGKKICVAPFRYKLNEKDYVTTSYQLNLFKDFYLPVYFNQTTVREFKSEKRRHTDDELRVILEERLSIYLEKIEEKGIQIIGKDVTINLDESNAYIFGKINAIIKSDMREAQVEYY